MQLVINTYGAYLRKSGSCFLVKKEEKSFEVAVGKVSSILIMTAAYITTDAIKLAVDNNIDIVFLDAHGDPYGRVWHPKLGSTTLIRRRQLEIYESLDGLNLAKEWGLKKLDNQIDLLSRLKKAREEKREELGRFVSEIEHSREQIKRLRGTIDTRRQDMLGLEGKASRAYFEALSASECEDDVPRRSEYAQDLTALQMLKAIPTMLKIEENTKLIPQMADNTEKILEEVKGLR